VDKTPTEEIKLNTKKLALTIMFAALAIALNPTFTQIQMAAPFAQGLIYQIWEIPIVVALLIISPIAGVAISLLNTLVLFAIFPGYLPTGPAYNLAATLSMQVGIVAVLIFGKKVFCKNQDTAALFKPKWAITATVAGIFTRVAFMSVVLYFALPQPSPIGFSFPIEATIGYLPLAAIFYATLAAYTIILGFIIAQRVQKVLHLTLPQQTKCPIPQETQK
jgi:riboflavin transporter FmnP